MTWEDLKFFGYGLLRLSPSHLFTLTVHEIFDMVVAYYQRRDDEMDEEMTVLAWQTSHIMNSSGNYKKAVKPQQLYTGKNEQTTNETSDVLRPIDRDEKNEKLKALEAKFK